MTERTMGRMLRQAAVLEMTGLSRPTVYRMIAEGRFPRPVKIGQRAVGWRESTIQEWIASREGGAIIKEPAGTPAVSGRPRHGEPPTAKILSDDQLIAAVEENAWVVFPPSFQFHPDEWRVVLGVLAGYGESDELDPPIGSLFKWEDEDDDSGEEAVVESGRTWREAVARAVSRSQRTRTGMVPVTVLRGDDTL